MKTTTTIASHLINTCETNEDIMSSYNPQNRQMYTITDPNYIRCGESGYIGNDHGAHVTLHFPDGSAENFKVDGIALQSA